MKLVLILQPIMGVDGKELSPDEWQIGESIADLDVRRQFYKDARLMFDTLKKSYSRHGAICIDDLSQIFNGVKDTVYVDSGHLSLRGNQIVAREIVQSLERCGLFSRS